MIHQAFGSMNLIHSFVPCRCSFRSVLYGGTPGGLRQSERLSMEKPRPGKPSSPWEPSNSSPCGEHPNRKSYECHQKDRVAMGRAAIS